MLITIQNLKERRVGSQFIDNGFAGKGVAAENRRWLEGCEGFFRQGVVRDEQ